MSLTFEQAQAINHTIDQIHSIFPILSGLAFFFLLESWLPPKLRFESILDSWLTYVRFGFLVLLTLIGLSQGLFGGCFIHIPQIWLNDHYIHNANPVQFGLFGRQYLSENSLVWLRIFYLIGSFLLVWRTWIFYIRRVRILPPLRVIQKTHSTETQTI